MSMNGQRSEVVAAISAALNDNAGELEASLQRFTVLELGELLQGLERTRMAINVELDRRAGELENVRGR
jgi:hypothetical protein